MLIALPYWTLPKIPIVGPIAIQPFGVMVAIGVLVAASYTRKKALGMGVGEDTHRSYIMWLLGSGLIGAHFFNILFYEPEKLTDPLAVINVFAGISSYGGILGAVVGFLYFTWSRGVSRLAYAEMAGWGLLPGWIFGRLGCAIVHDHPGTRSDFALAVDFPADSYVVRGLGLEAGPRHDLGLYEFLYLIVAFVVLLALTRRQRPVGFVIGYVALAYAPARFLFEFLRLPTTDPRYFGLTFAQFVSIAVFITGVVLMVTAYRTQGRERRVVPAGEEPAGGDGDSGRGERAGRKGARSSGSRKRKR